LKVPKGDYSLYVDVADPDNWMLIVNKQTGQWGTKYDKTQDLGRVKMTMSKPLATVENLTYAFAALGGPTGKLTSSGRTTPHLCSSPCIEPMIGVPQAGDPTDRSLSVGWRSRFRDLGNQPLTDNYHPADTIEVVCDYVPEG
jgi:hypothetical protein